MTRRCAPAAHPLAAFVVFCLATAWAATLAGAASARPDPAVIDRAAAIRADVTARYASTDALVVTEASSTDVVGSLTLWSANGTAAREVPTARGVYYALCPTRATCPFPSRKRARAIAAFVPRRAALELAMRTFGETTADLVVVSLPTRRWVLLVLERSELASTGTAAFHVGDDPHVVPTRAIRAAVDDLTLRNLYAPFALDTGSDGTDTLVALQLAP